VCAWQEAKVADFDEVQFPEDIQWGVSGGPMFQTNVLTSVEGYEARNRDWSAPRRAYNVTHAVKTQEELDILTDFFRARGGRNRGFRFKDWMDYKPNMMAAGGYDWYADWMDGSGDGQALDQAGDGSANQVFQLIKTYTDTWGSHIRKITKPRANTMLVSNRWSAPSDTDQIFENTFVQNVEGAWYDTDTTTGEVTFKDTISASGLGAFFNFSGYWWLNQPGNTLVDGLALFLTNWTGADSILVNNKRMPIKVVVAGTFWAVPLTKTPVACSGGDYTTAPQVIELEWYWVGGDFDVPVRFDSDSMPVSIDMYQTYTWGDIRLVEVRDPESYIQQASPSVIIFHHERLDPDIAYGAVGGPKFNTNVFSTTGGHEARPIRWDEDRPEYDIAEALKDFEDFIAILEFFLARYGKTFGFRFRDWADYNMSGTEGTVTPAIDGTEAKFQIVKEYTSGGQTWQRQIFMPVEPNEEIMTDKYGCQTFAPDFTITIGGVDYDHDTNVFVFDINGRLVQAPAGTSTGERNFGGLDLRLTVRFGQSGTENQLTITGITNANPAVVTVAEDLRQSTLGMFIQGLVTGESVWITGVSGMSEVNDARYKITRIAGPPYTKFQLDNTDSSLWGVYAGPSGIAQKHPHSSESIVITGDFDVPVRFGTDELNFTLENHGFHTWDSIPLIGLRLT
jgi:uncharacterized protein (TIGR02217 family)